MKYETTGFPRFPDLSDLFRSFSDIFEDLFGFGGFGGARETGVQAGSDLRYDLVLDFLDATLGTEVTIEVPRVTNCRTCAGSGAKPGTKKVPCPQCGGRGVVTRSHGIFQISTTFSRCGGLREFIAEPCPACHVEGQVRDKKKLKVRIPPGMDSGTHLIMAGEGNEGRFGGPPGDLYIILQVKPHEMFKRDGFDLRLEVPISFVQAALGTRFTIPTLTDSHELTIPPGTQPGEIIRLKGEGVPYPKGPRRGDLLVQVKVVIPTTLTPRQQELLKDLAKEEPGGQNSALREPDGDHVEPGLPLTEGSMNPHLILRIQGRHECQKYLLSEVQKVYRSQGQNINDKHFEVIIRKMMSKIQILRPGDTNYLPGDLVDLLAIKRENER